MEGFMSLTQLKDASLKITHVLKSDLQSNELK